jgi:hypothetical protein
VPFSLRGEPKQTGWVPAGSRRNVNKMKNRFGFSKRRSSLRRWAARYTEEPVKRKRVSSDGSRGLGGINQWRNRQRGKSAPGSRSVDCGQNPSVRCARKTGESPNDDSVVRISSPQGSRCPSSPISVWVSAYPGADPISGNTHTRCHGTPLIRSL